MTKHILILNGQVMASFDPTPQGLSEARRYGQAATKKGMSVTIATQVEITQEIGHQEQQGE